MKEKLNKQMPEATNVLEPLQKLNLMDDFLFDVTTVDLEACKIILELSLGFKIREIKWKEGQKVIHNLPGKRGIRMDFYVIDEEGQIFDVEMQKRNEGNIPKGQDSIRRYWMRRFWRVERKASMILMLPTLL